MRIPLPTGLRPPSPAAVVAILALTVATAGTAVAADKVKEDKDEITITTLVGGPVDSTDPFTQVPIPLTDATFVQQPGEMLVISATAELVQSEETAFCGALVVVTDTNHPEQLGLEMFSHTELGDWGQLTDSAALGTVTSPTTRQLAAYVIENGGPGSEWPCDSVNEEEPDGGQDTYTATVTVTVTTLRD